MQRACRIRAPDRRAELEELVAQFPRRVRIGRLAARDDAAALEFGAAVTLTDPARAELMYDPARNTNTATHRFSFID